MLAVDEAEEMVKSSVKPETMAKLLFETSKKMLSADLTMMRHVADGELGTDIGCDPSFATPLARMVG